MDPTILDRLNFISNYVEDIKENITEYEYLTLLNNLKNIYTHFHSENLYRCTCTDESFNCYLSPVMLFSCRRRELILEKAPFLILLLNYYSDDQRIIPEYNLELEAKYDAYDQDFLIKFLIFILILSENCTYSKEKIICAISIFNLIFTHFGILKNSKKLQEVVFNKLIEFESENSVNVLNQIDFSIFGININPIPIWRKEFEEKMK